MISDQGHREEGPTSPPDRAPASYPGRRDPRLVTRRRGGLLDDPAHRSLALWATACAEHVLAVFESEHPDDQRPRAAIEAARSWAGEQITMTGAHAAARQSTGAAAAAARAAGHAAATAHMADHELSAACYALRAVLLAAGDLEAVERERRWQIEHLPRDVRDLVLDDMHHRAEKFNGAFDH